MPIGLVTIHLVSRGQLNNICDCAACVLKPRLKSHRPGTTHAPMVCCPRHEVALSRSEKSEETLVQEVAGTMSRASCGNKEIALNACSE